MTSRSRSVDVLLLLGFCVYLFFFGCTSFGLVGADEPRYAQIAREMLARHDWVTPVLGGRPWLEKPVLYYWQAMLSYSVFGVTDWAARIPSVADALLMVACVYVFLRRFRPGLELDGALITASSAAVVGFAHAASTDMPLAAAFTIALLGFYAWRETGSRGYLLGFYFFIALGVLAKGPVAPALAAIVVLVFVFFSRDFALIKRVLWAPGIVLFLAVAMPWYIAVQLRNPGFFRVFILQHNLARFSTDLYHHSQPFWYYLPVALLGLVPWTILILAAVFAAALGRQEPGLASDSDRAWNTFLVIWLLAPVVFFSLSRSKLPGYILPAIPAGTLLLADYVRRHVQAGMRPPAWLMALHAAVASMILIPALTIQYILLQHRLPPGRPTLVAGFVGLALAVGIFATLRSELGLGMLRFVTLVPAVLAVAAIARIGGPTLDVTLSARPVAAGIARVEAGSLPAAVFRLPRETEYGLSFYRNQAIANYDRGEIPARDHLLITAVGAEADAARLLPGRRLAFLGNFSPQRLEYYWVSPPETAPAAH